MKRIILCFGLLGLGCLNFVSSTSAMNSECPLSKAEKDLFVNTYDYIVSSADWRSLDNFESLKKSINTVKNEEGNICVTDNNRRTILCRIVISNCKHDNVSEVINYIINADPNIANMKDMSGNAPLHYAVKAEGGNLILKTLIGNKNVDLNIVNTDGYTPLALAIENNVNGNLNDNIMLLLECKSCDVNMIYNDGYSSPLISAVKKDDIYVVQALLERPEINGNVKNAKGETPLGIAVGRGYEDYGTREQVIVTALLGCPGINVNVQDNKGRTPLHIAVEKGNIEAIKALLRCPGINVNVQDNEGRTPLGTCDEELDTDIIEILKRAGAC